MDILELLGKKHNDWIKMVHSFKYIKKKVHPKGGYKLISKEDAEDIVSEMYLRLYKYVDDPTRIMYTDTEVNTMFVYITLRNIYNSYLNDRGKRTRCVYNDDLSNYEYITSDETDTSLELLKIDLQDKILEEINSWHHYDSKLFKIVFYDQVSLRKLAKETGISVSSIFNTIKVCKAKLRDKFGDQFEELWKDYDV